MWFIGAKDTLNNSNKILYQIDVRSSSDRPIMEEYPTLTSNDLCDHPYYVEQWAHTK